MPNVTVAGRELHYLRRAWGEPFLTELERDFDCIVYDHRGIGFSGAVQDVFTLAELASDAVELLGELDVDTAHVVGISMGGMVAQELALNHPSRVRTLTLGCTYCGGPGSRLGSEAVVAQLGEAMLS